MPGDGTPPTFAKISDDLLGTELKDAGYTGLYTTWMVDSTDEYLCLSGGTLIGYNAPTSGKQRVISWYMRLKDGVQPGTYEVGFNAKQLSRLTATYCTEDAITAPVAGKNVKSITQDQVTYTNAMVKVGEAGPVVTKTQAEVKMTLNEERNLSQWAVLLPTIRLQRPTTSRRLTARPQTLVRASTSQRVKTSRMLPTLHSFSMILTSMHSMTLPLMLISIQIMTTSFLGTLSLLLANTETFVK